MFPKLHLFFNELKEKGLAHGLKRGFGFLWRPFENLIQRHRFLLELRYGIFPKAKSLITLSSPRFLKLPQSELVKEVRRFWYSNQQGPFDLNGEKIQRKEIARYGGPNPKFTCHICQKSEWLSRIRQKNLFIPHHCSQSKQCQELCAKQGNELFTHLHRNFAFSIGCDSNLPAPKCLYLYPRAGKEFLNPSCGIGLWTLRSRLAYCCQVEVIEKPVNVNWKNYDFLFLHNNNGKIPKFSRPNLPVILYGHDFWPLEKRGFQWVIDWVKPDIFLSTCIGPWQEYYKMPLQTKPTFYPFFDPFFNRPNLKKEKRLDLLVIGAARFHPVYRSRLLLNQQISKLASFYRIEFSNLAGARNVPGEGGVIRKDGRTGKLIRLFNKWSEYLGEAKYVIFGRMEYPVMVAKYYEALGCGAIPIIPEVPDLKYLGVKPFQHYLPLSEVEGNNEKLTYYLDHYQDYYYIAQNAVKWYDNFSDQVNFNYFENLIREITNFRYPKRLI